MAMDANATDMDEISSNAARAKQNAAALPSSDGATAAAANSLLRNANMQSASISAHVAGRHAEESARAIWALSADILHAPAQSISEPGNARSAAATAPAAAAHTRAASSESRGSADARAASRKFFPEASETREPSDDAPPMPRARFFKFERTAGTAPTGSEKNAALNTGASKPDILRM